MQFMIYGLIFIKNMIDLVLGIRLKKTLFVIFKKLDGKPILDP